MRRVAGRVVVVGGGIGGLAAAIALRRDGVEVTVLERAGAPRATGSGLVLSPNGMHALRALGAELAADVRAAGCVYGEEHRSRFTTAGGRTLVELSFAGSERTWGQPVVGILRSRLHEVLLRHATAASATVRPGAAVTGFTEPAAAVLADGGTVEGDLLVGADGVRSAVRSQLVGDGEPRYRGFTSVRGVGPAPAGDPYGFIGYGRGFVLFCSAVGGGQVYWVASLNAPAGSWPRKDAARAHQDVLRLLARGGWHPAAAGMVKASDPASCVITDIADRAPIASWHRGRVVLLGDAAHPMVYTMGQGANTTLEDAVVLAHHLRAAPSVEEALTAYSTERAPRLARMVRQSRMMGAVGQVRNPVAAWLRDRAFAIMPRLVDLDQQNAPVFGWRPPGHVPERPTQVPEVADTPGGG